MAITLNFWCKCVKIIIFLAFSLFLGCASYKVDHTGDYQAVKNERMSSRIECARQHWLYKIVPYDSSIIRWYDVGHWCTWILLGNDDDGIFGERNSPQFHVKQPISTGLAFRWWFRNPLHNFTHYVIGSASRQNSQYTLVSYSKSGYECFQFHEKSKKDFFLNGPLFFLGFHGGKPFIEFKVMSKTGKESYFYLGWREKGNFGCKLALMSRKKFES